MTRAEKVLTLVVVGAVVTFGAIYLAGGERKRSPEDADALSMVSAVPEKPEPAPPPEKEPDPAVSPTPPAPQPAPAPVKPEDAATSSPVPPPPAPAKDEFLLPSPIAGTRRYKVRAGDTYERIAVRVWNDGRRAAEISRLNPDLDPRRLVTGTELVMPDLPASPAPPAAKVSPAPAGEGELYTVESGDSLIAIARKKYGNARLWKTLLEANKATIPDPGRLRKGMQIRIPPAPAAGPANAK